MCQNRTVFCHGMTQNFAKFLHEISNYPFQNLKLSEKIQLHLDKIKKIKKVLNSHNITLLYAAKDTKNNQAIILKDFIENIKFGA